MTRALDHDFPLRSALSTREPRDVSIEDQRIALETELARRQRLYPNYVARAAMTQDQAAEQIHLCQQLVDDARWHEWVTERAAADARGRPAPPPPRRHPGHASWEDRVRELRRDLAIRRNTYPRYIASATNPLTAAEAGETLACLDAVHYRYWATLDGFTAIDVPPARDHARAAFIADAECRARSTEWNAALAEGRDCDRGHWHRVGALATRLAAGGALLPDTGQAALDRLLTDHDAVWQATMLATNAGNRPAHILDWHLMVDTWLLALRRSLAIPATSPEPARLAA